MLDGLKKAVSPHRLDEEKEAILEFNLRESPAFATFPDSGSEDIGGSPAFAQMNAADQKIFGKLVNTRAICSGMRALDPHWRRDLAADHMDILENGMYVPNSSNTGGSDGSDDKKKRVYVPKLYYPHTPFTENGIVRLKKFTLKNNTLFNILSSTYKNRSDDEAADPDATEKFRVTFVTTEGMATNTVHFQDEKDYWNLVFAVKAAAEYNSTFTDNSETETSEINGTIPSVQPKLHISSHTKTFGKNIVSFSGRCLYSALTAATQKRTLSAPTNTLGLFGSTNTKNPIVAKRTSLLPDMLIQKTTTFLSGSGDSDNPNIAAEKLTPFLIEVYDFTLRVFDPAASSSSGDVFSLDINNVVAMFVTANSRIPKSYMLECALMSDVDVVNSSGVKQTSTGDRSAGIRRRSSFGTDAEDSLLYLPYEAEHMDCFTEDGLGSVASKNGFLDKYSIQFSLKNPDQDTSSLSGSDVGNSAVSPVVPPYYSTGNSLLLPVTESDIIESVKQVGIESNAEQGGSIGFNMPFAVSVVTDASMSIHNAVNFFKSKMNINSNLKAEVVADNVIPYNVFLSDSYYAKDTTKSEEKTTATKYDAFVANGKGTGTQEFSLFRNPQVISSTYLKTNDYLNSKILIQKKGLSRALRIVIRTASDLEVFDGKGEPKHGYLPSVYCTVYLVDNEGNKLSMNTQDVRTNMCPKSCNPEWNREIYLQKSHKLTEEKSMLSSNSGNDDFLEGVAGVRIVLRDGASGYLKHDHLGQAMLPLHCFLYQQEANFHLPIETSYRTNVGDTGPKGEIFLTTEMITVEAIPAISRTDVDTNNVRLADPPKKSFFDGLFGSDKKTDKRSDEDSSTKFSSNISDLHIRRAKSDDAAIITIRYCIYNVRTLNTFWPIRSLVATDNGIGHVFFGQSCIFLKLLPGVGGLLSNCSEYNEATKTISIPYVQMKVSMSLTTSVVYLNISINSCTSTPTQKSKGELIYSLVDMALLVTSCPAADIQSICISRYKSATVRQHLLKIKSILDDDIFATFPQLITINDSATQAITDGISYAKIDSYYDLLCMNAIKINNDEISGNTITKIAKEARRRSRSFSSLTQIQQPFIHFKPHLSRSRVFWKVIERTIDECLSNLTCIDSMIEKHKKGNQNENDDYQRYIVSDLVSDKQSWLCLLVRCFIYAGNLVNSFKILRYLALDGLKFSVNEVLELSNSDRNESLIITPLRKEANPWTLADRHNYIYQAACCRLRDYLLCSSDYWGVSGGSSGSPMTSIISPSTPQKDKGGKGLLGLSSPASPTLSSNSFAVVSENMMNICGSELISSYNNTLKMSLFPFISSRDAFSRISGQELKTVIAQLVITTNGRLNHTVSSILRPLGLTIDPNIMIMPEKNVQHVTEWYTSILQGEVNSFLGKTMQNASKNKSNKFNLPYDVEKAGNLLISTLPETLKFQLNIILDLCTKLPALESENDNKISTKQGSDILCKIAFVSLHGRSDYTFQAGEDDDDSSCSAWDSVVDDSVYLLNTKIMQCVVSCLCMLAEEYQRVLQSKHWMQGNRESGELKVFIEFLVSIINDSYRLRSSHLDELRKVYIVDKDKKRELLQRVLHSFNVVEDKASQKLIRIIYSDIQSIMLDFDTAWIESQKSISKEIVATLNYHFTLFQKIMYPVMYIKLLIKSINVVALRYLIHLIEKKNRLIRISPEDIDNLQRDIKMLKMCFEELYIEPEFEKDSDAGASDDSSSNGPNTIPTSTEEELSIVDQQFQYLILVVDLIGNKPGSEKFNSALKTILQKYSEKKFAGLTTAILDTFVYGLNPESQSPEFGIIVRKLEIETTNLSLLTKGQRSQSLQSNISSGAFTSLESVDDLLESKYFITHSNEFYGNNDLFKFLFLTNGSDDLIKDKRAPTSLSKESNLQKSSTDFGNSPNPKSQTKLKTLGISFGSFSSSGGGVQKKNRLEDYHANIYRLLRLDDDETCLAAVPGRLGENNLEDRATTGSVKGSVRDHASEMADDDVDSTILGSDVGTYEPPDCIVNVSALEVKGLKTSSLFSKCHPYIAVSLGNQRLKTPTGSGNEFKWPTTVLSFNAVRSRLYNSGKLSIKVFDKELISRKRTLGGVSVKVPALLLENVTAHIESWFALESISPSNAGEVFLKISVENLK